jgi:hypothetical protein
MIGRGHLRILLPQLYGQFRVTFQADPPAVFRQVKRANILPATLNTHAVSLRGSLRWPRVWPGSNHGSHRCSLFITFGSKSFILSDLSCLVSWTQADEEIPHHGIAYGNANFNTSFPGCFHYCRYCNFYIVNIRLLKNRIGNILIQILVV